MINYELDTMEIVDATTGALTYGPSLPITGSLGCATAHDGYVYWVRGRDYNFTAAEYFWSPELYRAKGTSIHQL